MVEHKFTIDLPEGADEKAMQRLAEELKPVVLTEVRLVKRLIFEVDQRHAQQIVQDIVRLHVIQGGKGNGHKPAEKTEMSRASYRFVDSWVIMTTQRLNKLIKAMDHSLLQRVVENHKGERYVVMKFFDIDLGTSEFRLIREPKE